VTVQDLVVVLGAVALSGALAWFFFGPRRARAAELVGDVQQVRVTVRGGYSPAAGAQRCRSWNATAEHIREVGRHVLDDLPRRGRRGAAFAPRSR
jgi:hypothetical protein